MPNIPRISLDEPANATNRATAVLSARKGASGPGVIIHPGMDSQTIRGILYETLLDLIFIANIRAARQYADGHPVPWNVTRSAAARWSALSRTCRAGAAGQPALCDKGRCPTGIWPMGTCPRSPQGSDSLGPRLPNHSALREEP